jgi:serine/threonine-protein kinase
VTRKAAQGDQHEDIVDEVETEAEAAAAPSAEPKAEPKAGTVRVFEPDGKEMVYVPAGEFLYGEDNETRSLPGYWIDKTPVTNAEYAKFINATGHRIPEHWTEGKPPTGKEEHPVVNISWQEATTYCRWAGKRLPTEEEWEKAARGVDGRIYPWGDEEPNERKCNYNRQTSDTTQVGRHSPQGDGPYGSVDMAGNVWEWINEWYDGDRNYRVLRGGSWISLVTNIRSTDRNKLGPAYKLRDVGFRCAYTESL